MDKARPLAWRRRTSRTSPARLAATRPACLQMVARPGRAQRPVRRGRPCTLKTVPAGLPASPWHFARFHRPTGVLRQLVVCRPPCLSRAVADIRRAWGLADDATRTGQRDASDNPGERVGIEPASHDQPLQTAME